MYDVEEDPSSSTVYFLLRCNLFSRISGDFTHIAVGSMKHLDVTFECWTPNERIRFDTVTHYLQYTFTSLILNLEYKYPFVFSVFGKRLVRINYSTLVRTGIEFATGYTSTGINFGRKISENYENEDSGAAQNTSFGGKTEPEEDSGDNSAVDMHIDDDTVFEDDVGMKSDVEFEGNTLVESEKGFEGSQTIKGDNVEDTLVEVYAREQVGEQSMAETNTVLENKTLVSTTDLEEKTGSECNSTHEVTTANGSPGGSAAIPETTLAHTDPRANTASGVQTQKQVCLAISSKAPNSRPGPVSRNLIVLQSVAKLHAITLYEYNTLNVMMECETQYYRRHMCRQIESLPSFSNRSIKNSAFCLVVPAPDWEQS